MQTLTSSEFFQSSAFSTRLPGMRVTNMDLTPQMSVSVIESESRQHFQAVTEGQSDARIHFSCQLRGSTRVSQASRNFELNPSHVLASFAPDAGFHLDCSPGWCNVELRITASSLFELAGDEYGLKCLNTHSACCLLLNPNNAHIRDAAARLVNLLTVTHPCSLLVQAAALEFIAWHLKNLHANETNDRMCSRECRLLWLARERLLSDLSSPPTIEQLARETGLNQLKIKQGFKVLFGTTTYGLFQRERMERALTLLQTNSVTETASLLGYSNISHFSEAFRKQFGVLPSAARRKALV